MHNKCRLSVLRALPADCQRPHPPTTSPAHRGPIFLRLDRFFFWKADGLPSNDPLLPAPSPDCFWPSVWTGWTKWGVLLLTRGPEGPTTCGAGSHHSWTGTWPISQIRHHAQDGAFSRHESCPLESTLDGLIGLRGKQEGHGMRKEEGVRGSLSTSRTVYVLFPNPVVC
jgi:hypothetical protein